jgi:tetratricopeptide (TPR) repeat protein
MPSKKNKKRKPRNSGTCVGALRNAAREIMNDKLGGLCTLRAVTLITEIQMKFARTSIALAIIIASCNLLGQAAPQATQSGIESADRLFQLGKFAEAGELYARIVAQNPNDYSANLQLGRIALLSNQLEDAQKWLEKAITLHPGDADAKVMLAEVFYRRDDFQKAAASLSGVDVSSNKLIISQYPTLNVAKLESFTGQTPYELHGNGTSTRLKFVKTDPLPVVSVRINGGDEVTFFIDTGGS